MRSKLVVLALILMTFVSIFGYKQYEKFQKERVVKAAAECVVDCYNKFERYLIQGNTLESEMIVLMPQALKACCTHCGVEVR